ncbi:uncharacterized protein [Panulirus ornatus]|uniref:uncharacterized protein n=1 Tax=Panulirus ornatus TaxID=150431 RepID=UPI003A849A21
MSRRKMSVSSVLGDVCRKVTRKMTIHDPSTVSSLIQSLNPQNPTIHQLTVDDLGRARASSLPPPSVRSSDPGTRLTHRSEEEEHSHQGGDTTPSDDLSSVDGDEYMKEYLREQCEGDDRPSSLPSV